MACVWPRAVPVPIPVPVVDRDAADAHLREIARRVRDIELADRERALFASWSKMQALAAKARRPGAVEELTLAKAQQKVRHDCGDVILYDDVDRYLLLGDLAALAVVRQATGLANDDPRVRELGEGAAAGLTISATRAGILDARGRVLAHPAMLVTLVRIGWRIDCGLIPTARLEPEALAIYDVFKLRFGRALPLDQRLRALERHAERHPEYHADLAKTALYQAAGRQDAAVRLLTEALDRAPGNLALRNYLLHARVPRD